MLQNAYLDAKIGFDPAENEPPKECCVVARKALVRHEPGGKREDRPAGAAEPGLAPARRLGWLGLAKIGAQILAKLRQILAKFS